jgi:exopolysaccharide biosynthesis protein
MKNIKYVGVAVGLLFSPVGAASLARQPSPPIVWQVVSRGVEHARFVRTADASDESLARWSINALRIDPSEARLDVVHAHDKAVGVETVSSVSRRFGAVAAINGGYFRTTGPFRGDSTGTLQIDGVLLSEPDRGRAAVGFIRNSAATRLIFGHLTWDGVVISDGRKRVLSGINRPRRANEVILFTPQFDETTLTDSSGTEVVIRSGRVDRVRDNAGSTPIPSDGFVLSSTGSARGWMRALTPGTVVSVGLQLKPAGGSPRNMWTTAEDVLGAGPKLVTAGRVNITTARERMLRTFATERHPRTAIAALADGRALLLVVDGRQPSVSVGMSLAELARLLIELGAHDGINLDGGGSTTMVVKGTVVNRPSDPTGERPVSDAILVLPRPQTAPSRRLLN